MILLLGVVAVQSLAATPARQGETTRPSRGLVVQRTTTALDRMKRFASKNELRFVDGDTVTIHACGDIVSINIGAVPLPAFGISGIRSVAIPRHSLLCKFVSQEVVDAKLVTIIQPTESSIRGESIAKAMEDLYSRLLTSPETTISIRRASGDRILLEGMGRLAPLRCSYDRNGNFRMLIRGY